MTQKTVWVILMDDICDYDYEGWFHTKAIGVANTRESAWKLLCEQYKYEAMPKNGVIRSYYDPEYWDEDIREDELLICLSDSHNRVQFRAVEVEIGKFYEKGF